MSLFFQHTGASTWSEPWRFVRPQRHTGDAQVLPLSGGNGKALSRRSGPASSTGCAARSTGSRSTSLTASYTREARLSALAPSKVALMDLAVPRRQPESRPVLPARAGKGKMDRTVQPRRTVQRALCTTPRRPRGQSFAASSSARPSSVGTRLHGGLGAPEAQRSGPAHGSVQGPVPNVPRTSGSSS